MALLSIGALGLDVLTIWAALASPPPEMARVARMEAELMGPASQARCLAEGGCALSWFAATDALAGRASNIPEAQGVARWRGGPLPDLSGSALPITLNSHVEGFIDFFTERGKFVFARWYARMGRYHREMTTLLEAEGLPPDLLYVCMIESGFTTDAVSRAGAVGPWQFTEPTGRSFQLKVDDWIDERRDPVKSTRAAARYLKRLHERFGDWPLALAAYNAGPGAVRRAMAEANTNDYWGLVERGALPRQASRYVAKIMAAQIIGRHPERFGFADVRALPPEDAATVPAPGGVDLKKLSKRLPEVTFEDLERLNPELRRGFTPPYGSDYPLRVPARARKKAMAALSGGGKALSEYTVRFGERAVDIARAHRMGRATFRRLNELSEGEEPAPGQAVLVTGRPAPLDEAAMLTYVAPEVEFEVGDRQAVYFPVRWSLTVDEIADFFRVHAADVAMWNDLDPRVPLQRGMVLRLFLPKSFDVSTAVLAPAKAVTAVRAGTEAAEIVKAEAPKARPAGTRYIKHTLAKGDRLWNLARDHGTTVGAIRAANGLGPKERVKIGAELRIPTRTAPKPEGRAKRREAKPAGAKARTHVVKKGDSLWKIARKYDVDIKALKRRNKLKSDQVYLGQKLLIPR